MRQASGQQGQPGLCPLTCSALVSRELLNAHKDNLGTTIKFVIFNELSNARNPNNMQILYTVLQHSSELAPKVGTLSVGQPLDCISVRMAAYGTAQGGTPGFGWEDPLAPGF